MRFEHTVTYPARLEIVAAMLTNVDYARERFAAAEVSAQVEDDPTHPRSIIAHIPLDSSLIPESAQRFIPPDTTITLTEAWDSIVDDVLSGTLVADFPGLPLRLSSQSLCTEHRGVTQRTIKGELTVSLPFIGGRVEQMIEEKLAALARKEEEFAARWLAHAG